MSTTWALACWAFIVSVVFASWLVSMMMRHVAKRLIGLGTKQWTGRRAAKRFLKEEGMDGAVKVVTEDTRTNESYDAARHTIYIGQLSANSYSLYNYVGSLRQAVVSVQAERKLVAYAARMAIQMAFRMTGSLLIPLAGLTLAFDSRELLVVLTALTAAFVVFELVNTSVEFRIARQTNDFSARTDALGPGELREMRRFNAVLSIAEWSSVWNGLWQVLTIVPRYLEFSYQLRQKHRGQLHDISKEQ